MTTISGTLLGVEGGVSSAYDVGHGQGYQVEESMTIDGTPTEESVKDSVWAAIEEAGDLPVYVQVTLTYAGHDWPWTDVISKFDVKYQAVHLAEGTTLLAIGALIWALLPLVAEFIFIILQAVAITWAVLQAIDVAEWLAEQDPVIAPAAFGAGLGIVLVAAVVIAGGNK